MYTKYCRKISVGQTLESIEHGLGECIKIDHKSKDFRYLFRFNDGTLKWMSLHDCNGALDSLISAPQV